MKRTFYYWGYFFQGWLLERLPDGRIKCGILRIGHSALCLPNMARGGEPYKELNDYYDSLSAEKGA